MKPSSALTWIAALVALAATSLGEVRAEGVRWETLQIPAAISGSKTYSLEALVVRPDDGEPHPLAVINHGSPRDAADRPRMSALRMWAQAIEFARRGWVAVTFLRRGYGRSEGGRVEISVLAAIPTTPVPDGRARATSQRSQNS